jgi:hypothetical protein
MRLARWLASRDLRVKKQSERLLRHEVRHEVRHGCYRVIRLFYPYKVKQLRHELDNHERAFK